MKLLLHFFYITVIGIMIFILDKVYTEKNNEIRDLKIMIENMIASRDYENYLNDMYLYRNYISIDDYERLMKYSLKHIINNLSHNYPKSLSEFIDIINPYINKLLIRENFTFDEEMMLQEVSSVIYCESRNSIKEMKLVLSVIINRSSSRDIKSYFETISKKNQFECKGKEIDKNEPYYYEVMNFIKFLVLYTIYGDFQVKTHATHYFNHHRSNPSWRESMVEVYSTPNHTYLISK